MSENPEITAASDLPERKYPEPAESDVEFALATLNRMDTGDGIDDRQLQPLFPGMNTHQYLGVVEELERRGQLTKHPVLNSRGKVGYMKYRAVR